VSAPARLVSACLVLATVAAVACTGGGGSSSSPAGPSSTLPSGPVEIVRGEYTLDHAGVAVRLHWEGTEGTMTIDNGSELDLAAPSVYVVTQEAEHVDVELPETPELAPGESAELDITFPVPMEDMGMIFLEFGGVNWGALSPVVEAA
jgi:hypothetical protein